MKYGVFLLQTLNLLLKGKVFDPGGKSPQITKIIHLKSSYTNINKHHSLLGYNISPLAAHINSSFRGISSQGILLLDAVIFTVLKYTNFI